MGPPWLVSEGDSGLVGYSLDLVKDAFVERTRLSLMIRFPQRPDGGPGPADALAEIGRDRRVFRGFNEPAETYLVRLLRWLDDRRTAGSAYALMDRLSEYTGDGCVFKTVDAQGNWYVRAADGTKSFYLSQNNWEWDSHPTEPISGLKRWARFWVIIHPNNGIFTPGLNWGDVTGPDWGDGSGTWGSTATPDQVKSIRAIIAEWKPAGTKCSHVIIAFDPASFDPSDAVADPGMPNYLWEYDSKTVGGVSVPTRLSTARYWDGS